MEVAVDPSLAASVYQQLQARNAVQSKAFVGIISDYLLGLQQCRDLQVRNAQLDKEAGELRLENDSLRAEVEQSRFAAASSQQVAAVEARLRETQEELTDVLRKNGKLVEDQLHASQQLQVVREMNESQGRQLEGAQKEVRELKARVRELTKQVDDTRAAHAAATSELEARLADKEAAEAKASKLEIDNIELSNRLVEMKATEMERMNEVNRMCEEMISNAKQYERAAAAAAAQATAAAAEASSGGPSRRLSRSSSSGSGVLIGQLRTMLTPASSSDSPVPSRLGRSVPAHDGGCFALAFDRAGGRLATGGGDKGVKVWDPTTGTHLSTLAGMLEGVLEVSFTADQRSLLAAGAEPALRMWALDSQRVRHTLTGHAQKVTSVDCSPTEPNRAASSGADRCIKVWDLAKGYCARTIMCHSTCHSLRVSQEGALICSGHFDGTLRFWDARQGGLASEVAGLHKAPMCSVAIGAYGYTVLTSGKDNVLKLVDTRTFSVRKELRAPGFAVAMAVGSPACLAADEKHAAAGSSDGQLFVWDVEKAVVVKTLSGAGPASVLSTAWSPQGLPLVSSDKAGNLVFWN